MKLNAAEAQQFCKSPDRRYSAVLIYGEDGVEVERRRGQVVKALIQNGDDQSVVHLDVGEARRSAGAIQDAMKSRGLFGGEPIVIIDKGTDGLAKNLEDVLSATESDDAFLIVSAGILPARSKLRKLFEAGRNTVAAPCYITAPSQADVREMLASFGAPDIEDDAMRDLVDFARSEGRGPLNDLISRLSLYALSSETPISSEDVIRCLPGAGDANIDDVLDAVANGEAARIGPLMSKLNSQGVNPTTLAISLARKFRQLHAISAAKGPAEAVISGLRPPVFGPRRDTLIRQARIWSTSKCEGALKLVIETDSTLRGGAKAAGFALLERAMMRLALGAKR